MATKKKQTGRTRGLKGKTQEAAAEVAKRVDTAELKKSRDAAAARGDETASAAVSRRGAGGKGRARKARRKKGKKTRAEKSAKGKGREPWDNRFLTEPRRHVSVTWGTKDDERRTRRADRVMLAMTQDVGFIDARITDAHARVICEFADATVYLVNVHQNWVARARTGQNGCKTAIEVNVAWVVYEAEHSECLDWEIAVAFAQIFVDAMCSYARIGYRESREKSGQHSTRPSDWRSRSNSADADLERIIRGLGNHNGDERGLAKVVAKAWGFTEANPPKLLCLRCTPKGVVETCKRARAATASKKTASGAAG